MWWSDDDDGVGDRVDGFGAVSRDQAQVFHVRRAAHAGVQYRAIHAEDHARLKRQIILDPVGMAGLSGFVGVRQPHAVG